MPVKSPSQYRYMLGVAQGRIRDPNLSRKKAQEFIDKTSAKDRRSFMAAPRNNKKRNN